MRRVLICAVVCFAASGCSCGDNFFEGSGGRDGGTGCPPGSTFCANADGVKCIDLRRSYHHCGGCGIECGPSSSCSHTYAQCWDGQCTDYICDPRHVGLTLCVRSGICTDLESDPAACGGCTNQCAPEEVCEGGECVAGCTEGLTECEGGCVDTASHKYHCGECGNLCNFDEQCTSGVCEPIPDYIAC